MTSPVLKRQNVEEKIEHLQTSFKLGGWTNNLGWFWGTNPFQDVFSTTKKIIDKPRISIQKFNTNQQNLNRANY